MHDSPTPAAMPPLPITPEQARELIALINRNDTSGSMALHKACEALRSLATQREADAKRIAELTQDRDEWKDAMHACVELGNTQAARIAELEAQVAAKEKDAARYRWLRDVGDCTWLALSKRPYRQAVYEIDAVVDAAIAQGQQPPAVLERKEAPSVDSASTLRPAGERPHYDAAYPQNYVAWANGRIAELEVQVAALTRAQDDYSNVGWVCADGTAALRGHKPVKTSSPLYCHKDDLSDSIAKAHP